MKANDTVHPAVTFLLYAWPYLSIPLAFSLDRGLRSRWLVEDASRPATGYRSKGANVQLVLTTRSQGASPSTATTAGGIGRSASAVSVALSEEEGQHHHEQSRGLDFTNLWPFALLCPCLFVFLAELSSDNVSALLVCTPFVILVVFSLTLGQVAILVSVLASPVVHVIYGIVNQGAGNAQIHSLLWSQAFVSLTAISLAWSIRDTIKLKDTSIAIKDGIDAYREKRKSSTDSGCCGGDGSVQKHEHRPPESWVIRSAEALLSGVSDDEDRALEVLYETMRLARQHGQSVDSLVLQTEEGLRAWREVVGHYAEVERCIRETNRWGALQDTLTNMNAGMPFMVGIVQGILLGASQLQGSRSFGSGSLGMTFYGSLVAYGISLVGSIFLLFRVIGLIDYSLYGLNTATKETEAVMEASVDTRSWRVLGGSCDIGCLSHIAAHRGMVRALEILVEHGADPRAVDSTGRTPLGIVREAGMFEASAYLETVASARDIIGRLVVSPRRGRSSVGRIWRKWRGGRRVSPLVDDKRCEFSFRDVDDAIEYSIARGRSAAHVSESSEGGDGNDLDVGASGILKMVLGQIEGASREWGTGAAPSRAVRDGSGGFTVEDPDIETPSMDGNTLVRRLRKEDENSLSRQAVGVDESREKTRTAPRQSDEVVSGTNSSKGLMHEGIRRGDITCHHGEGVESLTTHGWRTVSRNGGNDIDNDVVLGEEKPMRGKRCKGSSNGKAGSSIFSEIVKAVHWAVQWINVHDLSCWKRGRAGKIDVEPTSSAVTSVVDESPTMGEMRAAAMCTAQNKSRGPITEPETPRMDGGVVSPTAAESQLWMESKENENPEKTENTSSFVRVISHRCRSSIITKTSGTLSKLQSSDFGNPARGFQGASTAAAARSPTQSVLNISWGLRRLRSLSTPRERRATWKTLRETSPFHIPPMYLLPFVDLVALGEIPKRTGDRFWGHADRRPVPCWELPGLMSGTNGEGEPLVAYLSHRWLEPDFKNPDDHTKARFYQVCYSAQKLAKRKGRRPCDIYLWIDYACVNQQDPSADQLALPYILDSCDVMLYIEDEGYWEQALSRTEHFLFHRLRRLRRLAKSAAATTVVAGQDEDVFSLSWDGERLTQRTYAETRIRFAHNPAKGVLKNETDRLYLWTLVLALEYEDADNGGEEYQPALMRVIHNAVSLGNSSRFCGEPKDPSFERAETVI